MENKIYNNLDLRIKEHRANVLASLVESNEYRTEIRTGFDDFLFDNGESNSYILDIGDRSYFYSSAENANNDLQLLIAEWKDEDLYVDYHNNTDDDDNDTWIDANHKALKLKERSGK